MQIQTFKIWPIKAFSYIVTSDLWSYLIDLWWEDYNEIVRYIKTNEIKLDWVIFTHGHFDHIIWINKFVQEFDYKFPVYIWTSEIDFLYNPDLNLSFDFNWERFIIDKKIEIKTLENWDIIWPFEIKSTPWHTVGSICLLNHENKIIFSWDTLFDFWEWRTDLPTGNDMQLVKSIYELSKYLSRWYKLKAGH